MSHERRMKYLRPTQWLTPISGLSYSRLSVRATNATDCNGDPIPGPKHITNC